MKLKDLRSLIGYLPVDQRKSGLVLRHETGIKAILLHTHKIKDWGCTILRTDTHELRSLHVHDPQWQVVTNPDGSLLYEEAYACATD